MNWPDPLPKTVADAANTLRQAAAYLRERPTCANALFATGAVCGVGSPLYHATRDILTQALGVDFGAWCDKTPRIEQIEMLEKLGGAGGLL